MVEAQHVRRSDPSCFLLLKNFYECDLAHEEGLWRIARMRILNAWYEGDPRALGCQQSRDREADALFPSA